MMNMRSKDDAATNAVMIVAMVALAALLIVIVAVPKPSASSGQAAFRRDLFDKENAINDTDKQRGVIEAQVATQTWTIPEQQVGWSALSNVTKMTKAANLKLVSFRPQRRMEDGALIKLPYLVTVDGAYPQVLALIRGMEQPTNKLAVATVQVASADNNTDRVTASIVLVAYMNPSQEETPKNG